MALDPFRLTDYSATWRWKVGNFSAYSENSQRLDSPYFGFNKNEWCMCFYPCGELEESKDHLGLFLNYQLEDKFVNDEIKFKFAILTNDGKIKKETELLQHPGCFTRSYGFGSFLRRSEVLSKAHVYLAGDCLTIICQIIKSSVNKDTLLIDIPKNKIIDTFSSLLCDKNVGNLITLRVGRKDFKIYEGILTKQSPVFAAMLRNQDNKESRENLVEIKDIDAEVCEQMMEFLHTGEAPKSINDHLEELLNVAEKYELVRLKAYCEEAFYEQLTPENSSDTFITADLYNACQLKRATINFIINHMDEVRVTVSYKKMKKNYPVLGWEIVEETNNILKDFTDMF